MKKILFASIFRQLRLWKCKQTNDRLFDKNFFEYFINAHRTHERIDISKEIYLAESNNMICCHCIFNYGFIFQDSVYNGIL